MNKLEEIIFNIFSSFEIMLAVNIIIYSVVFYLFFKDIKELF